MAIVVIDLMGEEDDIVIGLSEKPKEKQERRDVVVPQTQLEIVPVVEEKRKKQRSRRLL